MIHYSPKIVVIGQEGVGKTSLILRFSQKAFKLDYKTKIGSDLFITKVQLTSDIKMTIKYWLVSGQDSFRNIRPQFYLHSNGGIFVFDITRYLTLQDLDEFYSNFTKKVGKVPLALFGNKLDLRDKREVPYEDAEMMANKFGCKYFETSALDGTGVESAFLDFTWKIVHNLKVKW